MKVLLLRRVGLCFALVVLPSLATAGVVSGNNLTSTTLPNYATTTNDLTSDAFALSGNGLYSISTTIVSTTTGIDISPYFIAGVSLVTPPTSSADLIANVRWSRTFGQPYPSTTSRMIFANTTGASTVYYNLGMGRFDAFKAADYRWQTSNNTLYGSAGTDGNTVPNASFENADANFFLGGAGSVVSGGVQGTNAWQMTVPTSSYLALPVLLGTTYDVSFWYKNVSGSSQYEFGFSQPVNGFSVGAGNTSLTINGLKDWTEVTASFTPTAGQSTWYLGGMSNSGVFQFDSISVAVAAVPEPASLTLCALGLAVVALNFRRRRC